MRKEIRKADKNFEIKEIDTFEYEGDIKRVYHASIAGYEKTHILLFLKQLKNKRTRRELVHLYAKPVCWWHIKVVGFIKISWK